MKYTKNIHNKLLLSGFKFIEEIEETEESEYLKYTIYKKGFTDVTVCDSHKEVQINLTADDEELSFLTLNQLMVLDTIINKKTTTK
ncbi:MAG: hypothetical protein H3C36_03005 [Chitinophagaceae bacterium]|nr:hypothetical protein [Chitinophagaceae bacterium]